MLHWDRVTENAIAGTFGGELRGKGGAIGLPNGAWRGTGSDLARNRLRPGRWAANHQFWKGTKPWVQPGGHGLAFILDVSSIPLDTQMV